MPRSLTINALQGLGQLRWVPLLAIATACSAGPQQMPGQPDESAVSQSSQSQQISTQEYQALEQVSLAVEDLIVSVEHSEALLAPDLRATWADVQQAGLHSQRLVGVDDGAGSVLVALTSLDEYVGNLDGTMPLVIAMHQRNDLPAAVQTAYDRLTTNLQAISGVVTEDANVEKARHHYYCNLTFLNHEECVSMGTVFEAWAVTKCTAIMASAFSLLGGYVSRTCDS
jgi:hypothetical protein